MPGQNEVPDDNRSIFLEAAQALFVDGDLDKFADYVSDEKYIQHNPLLPDGKAAVMSFLRAIQQNSSYTAEIKHLIVDGDIGMVHAQLRGSDGELSGTLVDMFRIEDGKLVEHWDVMTFKPDVG